MNRLSNSKLYVIYGFIVWAVVDLGAAGGFNPAYYKKGGPLLLFFYLSYPLIFSYLIYKKGWGTRKLFFATILVMFIFEGLLIGNPLILTFPALLIGVPLGICVYSFFTYVPYWILNKELARKKRALVPLSIIITTISLITTVSVWK